VTTIELGYDARDAFKPFHSRKERWACIVAHRRAGKTVACVHDLIDHALRSRNNRARFAYIAPFYRQAKAIAWQYLKDGIAPLLGYGASVNESELRVDLPNGSQIRLYGADNPDSLRGIYLDGVVLDEYADCDPTIWTRILRPALSDRKGWAVFIGTPKGHNGFYELWREANKDRDWYTLELRASETGLIDAPELAAAKKAMTDDEYEQEFECSFEAAITGSFYGHDIQEAEQEGRITIVPIEKSVPVMTAWDLGFTDSTAIWFIQRVGRELRVIDHYEAAGEAIDHYVRVLRDKDYLYDTHYFPHDVEAHELSTGKSRRQTLYSLGLQVTTVEMHHVMDGVNAVRSVLPYCWFDKTRCERGLDALRQYRREWDERLQIFRGKPLHDWTSHSADAFRCFAAGYNMPTGPLHSKRDKYRNDDAGGSGSWMAA